VKGDQKLLWVENGDGSQYEMLKAEGYTIILANHAHGPGILGASDISIE
jgi:hypothetical protein